MNRISTSAFCLAMFILNALGTVSSVSQQVTVPPPTPYQIISANANSRVFQRQVYLRQPNGQLATRLQKYTELASGLNRPDPNNPGQWIASSDGDLWLPQFWSAALPPADIANLYFQQINGVAWP